MLVGAERDLVCTRFRVSEDGLGECEEEEESLWQIGEMHGCFGGWSECE